MPGATGGRLAHLAALRGRADHRCHGQDRRRRRPRLQHLLTPIIGSLDLLHRKGVGDDRTRRLADGALQSAERAKTLVQRLLAFARRQPLKAIAVDVGQVVAEMAN